MTFLTWLEQTGVSTWINTSDSVFAYPTILLVHTIGLTLLAGLNIVIGMRILGVAPEIPVSELRRFFPLTWVGLALSVTSGAMLFVAKATRMGVNPAFYVKLTAIVFAIGVFFVMKGRIFGDPAVDERPVEQNGRMLALASIALWLIAITAGRWMAYVGEAAEFAALTFK
jgi:hypothetical protein